MKLDHFLPLYQFSEHHRIRIAAPREVVWRAAMEADLNRSTLTRALMVLRFFPARLMGGKNTASSDAVPALTMRSFTRMGFIELAVNAPEEYLLGLAGQFWTLTGGLLNVPPDAFRGFRQDGAAKAAWNLRFETLGPRETHLSTETRIHCMGTQARRRFLPYWMLIHPFSGMIRGEMLRIIKRAAEDGLPH